MKTNPFESLTREQRALIEEHHAQGLLVEEIGIKFGLDYDDVRNYCENFLSSPISHVERLTGIVADLEEAAGKAKEGIDSGEEDLPKLVSSYQKIMSELRIASTDLDNLKKPEDFVAEVTQKVFNPFVVDLIRIATAESSIKKHYML